MMTRDVDFLKLSNSKILCILSICKHSTSIILQFMLSDAILGGKMEALKQLVHNITQMEHSLGHVEGGHEGEHVTQHGGAHGHGDTIPSIRSEST